MKKTKKDFEKYVRSVVKKYQSILFIQGHVIDITFNENTKFLACGFNYPYLDTDIFYSDKAFEKWQAGEDLKGPIIHELCHIVTDPFYAKATSRYISSQDLEDERERLTDTICNIVRAYDS